MKPRFLRSGWFPIGLLSLALLVPVSPSVAQKKKPAPAAPSGLPTIAQPAPMGCQRGVPLEFTLTGTNLGGPAQLFLGFPAKVDILTDEKKPSDTAVKIRVETAKDAPLGIHPLRLATGGGLSNLRLFCVDDLPQILDNDANRDKAKPQAVQVPCVIAGKTDAEQSDWYKITATSGQRLSFEILGRRLGSPIDPLISIYSVKTQREVAHNNDSPGCQGDPRLSHVFKEAGDYLIEVRDVLGRGGPDYIYRLRIGDFPMANVPIPMAAKAGSKVQVSFAGPMIDGVKPVDVVVPNEPVGSVVWVTPKSASGLSGWPVPLFISDVAELMEKEPNDDAAKATRLPVPCGVTGRFLPGDMIDVYAIAAKKGQKIAIEAQTLEWGSPSLLYIAVKNAKGAEVAKSNPQSPPPGDQRVEVTVAEDGDLLIEVQHLLFQSGPAEAYHLSIRPVTPTFDIVLSQDKAEASAGNSAAIPFQVIRKGYVGPIDVTTRLLKSPITVQLKAGQTSGLLFVPITSGNVESFQVEAKAMVDGKPMTVLASAKPSVSKALADLVYPSQHLLARVEVGGRDKVPFSIAAKLEPAEASPGTTPSVVITVKRDEGFVDEVALNALIGLPANVPAPKAVL